jgi:hypothetical protein
MAGRDLAAPAQVVHRKIRAVGVARVPGEVRRGAPKARSRASSTRYGAARNETRDPAQDSRSAICSRRTPCGPWVPALAQVRSAGTRDLERPPIPVKLAQRLLARGRTPHLRAAASRNGPSEPLLSRSTFQVPGFGTLERPAGLSRFGRGHAVKLPLVAIISLIAYISTWRSS